MEKLKKEINYKKILIVIFVIACLVRILFITVSKIDMYQYDVGTLELDSFEDYEKLYERDESVMLRDRHLDYIIKIYQTGKLPDTNAVQQYHPPLHHIICAVWLRVMDLFPFSAQVKLESLQILTCTYSILILVVIWKILKELEILDKFKIITMLMCGFLPIFVYMSGLLNNDILLTLFSLLGVLYIFKWYKNMSYKNTILLAVINGLGALTKTSMIVNLPIVPFIFFIKFMQILYKEEYKNVKHIIFQGIIFCLIAFSMILVYPIRNYVLFGQELFSIHEASEVLYVGNDDLLARFGIFSKEILNNTLEYNDQNVLSYVIKSTIVFGDTGEIVLGTSFSKWISIILIIITLVSIIKSFFSKDINNYILIITYVMWIISFIGFNYTMPNSCTMHARYIITAIVMSLMLLSKILQNCKKAKFINLIMVLIFVCAISFSIVIVQQII